jgi:hypothetical protein
MGTIRGQGLLLRVNPRDHPRAQIPHVHAWVGSGEVVIELMPDRSVRLSEQHSLPVRGNVKRSDVKKALAEAARCYDVLMAEYERQL